MNHTDFIIERTDRYQGDLTSPTTIAPQSRSESGMASQASSKVEAGSGEAENPMGEREKQLESWMDQVKLFIRSIDIDRL